MLAGSLAQIRNPNEVGRNDDEHAVLADALHDVKVNAPGSSGWHSGHAAILRHTKNLQTLFSSAHALASQHDGQAAVGALRNEDRFMLGKRVENFLGDPPNADAVDVMDAASAKAAPLTVSAVGNGLMLVGTRTLFLYGSINEPKMLRLAALLRAIDDDYTDALYRYMVYATEQEKKRFEAENEGKSDAKKDASKPSPGDGAKKRDSAAEVRRSLKSSGNNHDSSDEEDDSPVRVPMSLRRGGAYGALASILGVPDEQDAPVDPRAAGPLHIQICSSGGAVFPTMGVLDVMDSMTLPIVTHCMGKSFSAGAVLLLGGDRRLMGPHSFMLFHEPRFGSWGQASAVEQTLNNVALAEDEMIRTLIQRTGMVEMWGSVQDMLACYGKEFTRSISFAYGDYRRAMTAWTQTPVGTEPRLVDYPFVFLYPWMASNTREPNETPEALREIARLLAAFTSAGKEELENLLDIFMEKMSESQAKSGTRRLPDPVHKIYMWYEAWEHAGHKFDEPLQVIKKQLLREYLTSFIFNDKTLWCGDPERMKNDSPLTRRLHVLFRTDIFLPAKWCHKLKILTEPPVLHSNMYTNLLDRGRMRAAKADAGRLTQMQKGKEFDPSKQAIDFDYKDDF